MLQSFLSNCNIYSDFSFFADDNQQLEVFVFYENGNVIYKIREEDLELYNEIFKSNVFTLTFDFTFGS